MTRLRALPSTSAAAALALFGCGGGEQRRGADEPAARSTVAVVEASFPAEQRLGGQARMRITVKNTGAAPLADVAVTVDSFSRRSAQPGEADSERPVWIVDDAPRGATTALANTWSLAGLRPGGTKSFRWRVTPIDAGSYRVGYSVATGLDGRARARDAAGGSTVGGTFSVRVSDAPSAARVDPETGDVERIEK
jgi:hypothetical protein